MLLSCLVCPGKLEGGIRAEREVSCSCCCVKDGPDGSSLVLNMDDFQLYIKNSSKPRVKSSSLSDACWEDCNLVSCMVFISSKSEILERVLLHSNKKGAFEVKTQHVDVDLKHSGCSFSVCFMS